MVSDALLCACGCQRVVNPGRRYLRGHHCKRPLEDRFWEKVRKTETCWLWTGGLSGRYGRIYCVDHDMPAHRFSYELHYGPIPLALECMHICDVPACVRPDHLRVGTHAENMADVAIKQRHWMRTNPAAIVRGSRQGNTHLTEEDVAFIRSLRAQGISTVALAKDYGVDRTTISLIVSRKTWKHVGG